MFKSNTNGFTLVTAPIMVKIWARKVLKKTNKHKTCVEKGIEVRQIFCVSIKKIFLIRFTKLTHEPGGGLLIANQKLCFHSDCLSPLWKVSLVVTKTTIQQRQMNVANSWVMHWAGDLSVNKLSPKPGASGELEGWQWEGWKDFHVCGCQPGSAGYIYIYICILHIMIRFWICFYLCQLVTQKEQGEVL